MSYSFSFMFVFLSIRPPPCTTRTATRFPTTTRFLSCLEDRAVDLKGRGERLGAGRFSFGSADRLMTYLGVRPGAVTPFAVINDKEDAVTMVLDSGVMGDDQIGRAHV